ncbi:MAG: OmpA family protein [Phycisphaerales bacterium]|jgi:chemotaxis protein MotB|nr:OmpA family protein [Phycisphaerales bacterium]
MMNSRSIHRRRAKRGIPGWVVTFGDMMALLLCFFILLQMFSEFKRDHEYQRVVTAIKEAFGFSGGVGVLPTDDIPVRSMVEILETMSVPKDGQESRMSQSADEGLVGEHTRVTRVQDGVRFTVGGVHLFDPMTAEVTEAGRAELSKLATLLAGRRNVILIRGHAAAKYLPDHAPWADLDELSYQRARSVHRVLLAEGLDDQVFRIEAVGAREPIVAQAMTEQEQAENRRVDIILTERLFDTPQLDSATQTVDASTGE